MPDISMCANTQCPLRKKCYRYRAFPGMYQTYADFKPKNEKECDNFWEAKGRNIDEFENAEKRNQGTKV